MDLSSEDVSNILTKTAGNLPLFGKVFFPTVLRQESPAFHYQINDLLRRKDASHIAIEVFRGGAKTTLLRLFVLMRVAWGLSRTVLFVSTSQDHSIASVAWIKKQVEFNSFFANFFKLRKGSKWTSEEVEIISDLCGTTSTILALGITGQVRGVNKDSYRPDLIICDDIENEETVATEEQRKKIRELFFGALVNSLAPQTEHPGAKVVLLQTPLHEASLIESLQKDSMFHFLKISCFNQDGESSWPTRWSTEELLKKKQSARDRQELHLFLREMEVTVTTQENAYFKLEWLRYWELLPERMQTIIAVDPAPAIGVEELSRKSRKDFQAVAVVGTSGGKVFLLEYSLSKTQTKDELIFDLLRLCAKYNPQAVVVESVAYQQILAADLRTAMVQARKFHNVIEFKSRQNKATRIVGRIKAFAPDGNLIVSREHSEFIEDYVRYPMITHDDLLDAVSMAIEHIKPELLDYIEDEYSSEYALPILKGCP